ncbi:MAG: thermonuclease family protein [bacterium]
MTTAKRAATRLPSLAAVALVAALAALACGPSSGAIPVPAKDVVTTRGPCSAERVLSGERVDLRCGTELVRVRLAGVAAPRPGHAGYTEAGRALRELLRERMLTVEIAGGAERGADSDGRVLAYLRDASGQNLNVALVLLGWATHAANDDGRLARNFELAEREAQRDQRAMWSVWPVTAEQADARP